MEAVRKGYDRGERGVQSLRELAQTELATVPDFRVQYCEIRALPLLENIEQIEGPATLAIAGFLGNTRLIDNLVLT